MRRLFSIKALFLLVAFSSLAAVIIMLGYSCISLAVKQQAANTAQSSSSSSLHGNDQLGHFGNLNTSSNPNQFNIPSNTNNPFPNLPPPLSTSSSISITGENKNTYTISSGFATIDNFVTIYTITGGLNSIKSSSDLIISTITKDFDSNANIGYVRSGFSSPQQNQQQQQNTLPNPFVDKSMINETISTAIQNAISSSSTSVGGYTQIKCNFGMNLADYSCNNNVPFQAK